MKKRFLLVILASLFLFPALAYAHQPRWVFGDTVMEIQNPDISQAFYGILKGSPHVFSFQTDQALDFYISLLTPDAPGAAEWVSAVVKDESDVEFFELDGESADWEPFHEPFGGDDYFQGPENTFPLEPGAYRIEVFNDENKGKYSMAVGKIESFPPSEIWNTIKLLPKLKKDFFSKSPFTAYFNYIGIFLFVILLVFAGLVIGVIWVFRHFKKRL